MSALPRADLLAFAHEKIGAARTLLKAGHASSAYYLAGCASELALKAAIASMFQADTLPDPRLVRSIYTHDLDRLTDLAALDVARRERQATDAQFAENWNVVRVWHVESCYLSWTKEEAERLPHAVGDENEGVLGWLTAHLETGSTEDEG